jgi:hypothetical protein
MDKKGRVLLVGLDPAVVDYSRAPAPGLTKEMLSAALDAVKVEFAALGYEARMLLIDTGETAETVLREALERGGFDCIMIGAGVRLDPDHFLLFEKLVNVVHRHAPASVKICFNTRPNNTIEAVQRWI